MDSLTKASDVATDTEWTYDIEVKLLFSSSRSPIPKSVPKRDRDQLFSFAVFPSLGRLRPNARNRSLGGRRGN